MRTDWYKPVMAAAGAPLRPETFCFAIRHGGPFYMPVDPAAYVNGLLPQFSDDDMRYLHDRGLGLGSAYSEALASPVTVHGVPSGSWFSDREVALTVTGPSALVSFLEAQVIWLRFRIQVATLAKRSPERLAELLGTATCEREREIILESLDAAGVSAHFDIDIDTRRIDDATNVLTTRTDEVTDFVGIDKHREDTWRVLRKIIIRLCNRLIHDVQDVLTAISRLLECCGQNIPAE